MALASMPMLIARKRRSPCLFTASVDLSNGVLSSMAAPRCVTKAHGMRKTLSDTKQGDERSHVVKAAAVCVARKPPFGKEEPSVSPTKSRSNGSTALKGFVASPEDQSKSIRVSIFRAPIAPPGAPPPPRIGKNQCAKDTAPSSRAQLKIASAMMR